MSKDWMVDIETEEEYDMLVSTGMAWIIFKDLPLSWEQCKKAISLKTKQQYVNRTRERNFKGSARLDGFN